MSEAIVVEAVSATSSKSNNMLVGNFYDSTFGGFKPENATMQSSIRNVDEVFDKMKNTGMQHNPFIIEDMQDDKNQRDYLRMSGTIREQMVEQMRDIFEIRTAEATGMYKTAFITKVFSKVVQGLTQLSSAQ